MTTEPFASGKTAKELGIDTKRKFVVIERGTDMFGKGDILKLYEDNNTNSPFFVHIETREGGLFRVSWKKLAYAPDVAPVSEPETTPEMMEGLRTEFNNHFTNECLKIHEGRSTFQKSADKLWSLVNRNFLPRSEVEKLLVKFLVWRADPDIRKYFKKESSMEVVRQFLKELQD